jgi:cytochrome c-type biogenesis protein CcmE
MMSPRIKFLLGGALVLGSAGYLMYSSTTQTAVYYLTPEEYAAKLSSDSTFHQTGVKLGARVVPGSIQRSAGGREVAFWVTDSVQKYRVEYRGLIPDTFSDSAEVVVDGRLAPNGTFVATTLLAKCGSRFESAPPEAYQRVMSRTQTS